MADYEFHPIAGIYPIMGECDLDDLAEDIKIRGLLEPIVLYEQKILDGRNRYLACQKAGEEPKYIEFKGDSPTAFVISKNSKRRHLTQSQKATIAVLAEPFFAEEAKKRMAEGGKRHLQAKNKGVAKMRYPKISKATAQAGQVVGVSPRYVQEAKRLKRKEPEVFEKVKSGAVTLSSIIKKNDKKQKLKTRERGYHLTWPRWRDLREKTEKIIELLDVPANSLCPVSVIREIAKELRDELIKLQPKK